MKTFGHARQGKMKDVKNEKERTCLHIAARTGNLALCQYLIDKQNASVNELASTDNVSYFVTHLKVSIVS